MNRGHLRRHLRRILVTVFVLAVFAWLGRRIWRDIGSVKWEELRFDPLLLGAAVAILAGAYLLRAAVWTLLLRSFGPRVTLWAGMRVFLLTHAGRYLPGKVWQFVGAGVLGLRYAIPPAASVGTTMIGVLIHEATGLILGLALVGSALGYPRWIFVLALTGFAGFLAVLCSPVLPWLVRTAARLVRRPITAIQPLPITLAVGLVAVYGTVWLLFGAGFLCLVRSVLPASEALGLATATGAITSACVLGFLAVFAPSGLGVREAVLAIILGPVLGVGPAALVAVLARVWMTLVEIMLMGWAALPFVGSARRNAAHEATA
jgi:hypothetical protein